MNRVYLLMSVVCLGYQLGHANVEARAEGSAVLHLDSTFERADGIEFRVGGHDFISDVLSSYPIYFRLRLDRGVVLAQTLVDFDGALDNIQHVNRPIRLALRTDNPDWTCVADPESISIMRWIKGESAIWFRIQTASDSWFQTRDGKAVTPTVEFPAIFAFGLSPAEETDRHGSANLPFNSLDDGTMKPTPFLLDTRDAEAKEGDHLLIDLIATHFGMSWDNVSTAQDPLEISCCEDTGINFSFRGNGIGVFSDQKHTLFFPWISNNDRYISMLYLSNPTPDQIGMELTVLRGTVLDQAHLNLPSGQTIHLPIDEILEDLEKGPGFSLALESDHRGVHAFVKTIDLVTGFFSSMSSVPYSDFATCYAVFPQEAAFADISGAVIFHQNNKMLHVDVYQQEDGFWRDVHQAKVPPNQPTVVTWEDVVSPTFLVSDRPFVPLGFHFLNTGLFEFLPPEPSFFVPPSQ